MPICTLPLAADSDAAKWLAYVHRSRNKRWEGSRSRKKPRPLPEALNEFQAKVAMILDAVFHGIHNAPVAWERAEWHRDAAIVTRRLGTIIDEATEMRRQVCEAVEVVKVAPAPTPGVTHARQPFTPAQTSASPVSTSPAAKVSTSAGTLKPALQRVVNAIGWWRQIGQDPVDRSRACVVAGLSPKASTFGVYIGELIKLGLVEASPGKIGLTPGGVALAVVPAGDTREQIHDVARGLLGPQEQRVFDAVYAVYPKEIARVDLANAVGLSPTASTLGVYIGGIAAYGIIENGSRGHVRAAGWLFP